MTFEQTGTYLGCVTAYQQLMLAIPDMAEADRIHQLVFGGKDEKVQLPVLAQSPITTLQEAINAGSAVDQQLSRGRAEGPYSSRCGSHSHGCLG